MQNLSLVDETFDSNLTFEYILSIQISLDGFSFSILDALQQKIVYLFHQELFQTTTNLLLKHIETIYNSSDLLHFPYKNTNIIISIPNRTQLIPDKLFENESIELYQKIAFKAEENHAILVTKSKIFEYKILTDIPNSALNYLKYKHPDTKIFSELYFWENFANSKDNIAYINISQQYISILLINDQNKLIYFNTFAWQYESDILYYVLGSMKNSNFNPNCVFLGGNINRFSYVYHQLKLYLKEVEIVERTKKIHYSYLLDKLPDARFTDLFSSFEL